MKPISWRTPRRPTIPLLALMLLTLVLPVKASWASTLASPQPAPPLAGLTLAVHTADGTPIAGAQVQIAPLGLHNSTDAHGQVGYTDIAVDRPLLLEVTVAAPGYRRWVLRNAVLYPNNTVEIDAPLSAALTGTSAPEVIDVPSPQQERRAPQAPAPAADMAVLAGGATNSTPPSTIRVYRVGLGRIDTVDFQSYVKHVLPNEWVASWPAESLRAGAMAAKTYAWYWCLHSKYPGAGYDVKDSTADQVYNPNVAYASTNAAVDATWTYRMTKSGVIFAAMYCAGAYNSSQTSGQCSALYGWTPGTYMSQNGSHYWADHGRGWQAIVSFYYSNLGIDTWSGSTCSWPLVQRGATGYRVQTVQYLLNARGANLTVDGAFGPATESAVRSFQSAHGLTGDGIVGPQTWSALILTVQRGSSGAAVRGAQTDLNAHGASLTVDGAFGPATESAVRNFQSAQGLSVDGIVGPNTWCKLVQ
jgi:hypothetical protein